jgi:hypothetical protein
VATPRAPTGSLAAEPGVRRNTDMGRRGRLERDQRAGVKASAAHRLPRWREVVRLLAAQWDPAGRWVGEASTGGYEPVAEALLPMFDAGGRDREVAEYLRSQELARLGVPLHSETERQALVATIHRAAKGDSPSA